MALAPWVLLPLVSGSREGSVRRAAAPQRARRGLLRRRQRGRRRGGAPARRDLAAHPRSPGPRRWRLLGWWTLFTVLATAWWSGPLLLLGRYAPPFLDYIENAAITTLPTDLTRSLLGVSDWVAYFGGPDFGCRPPRRRHAVPPARRGRRRRARAGRHVPAAATRTGGSWSGACWSG